MNHLNAVRITPKTIEAIAKGLGVTPGELLKE
jgi:DNA-binding Xre family transcriptional regulator